MNKKSKFSNKENASFIREGKNGENGENENIFA